MKNEVRLERLDKLYYMLKNHKKIFPQASFNMALWHRKPNYSIYKPASLNECGSAACALGSAACYKPFTTEGLYLSGGIPRFHDDIGFDAGAKFFGIKEYESYYLFDAGLYDRDADDIKPVDVAKKVNTLIQKYKNKGKKVNKEKL